MAQKQVLFISDSQELVGHYQKILYDLGVHATFGTPSQFKRLLSQTEDCDLLIFQPSEKAHLSLNQIEAALFDNYGSALLLIFARADLSACRLSAKLKSDFVLEDASFDECAFRIKNLLWPGVITDSTDVIECDGLAINVSTYTVTVRGEVVPLTPMEYSLLSYLVTHANRAFSRDLLLSRVWGFDYYGGPRTVDIHVRRIRSKLGEGLADRLQTVRSVGYLWDSK